MKKILLIIFLALCIFQLVVMATTINVGQEAINRPYGFGYPKLAISAVGAANADGKITSIEIYCTGTMYSCKVATFFAVDATHFTTRDYVTLGTVADGYTIHTKDASDDDISIDVEEGDYIGIYYSVGSIDIDYDEGETNGCWTQNSDLIPSENHEYTWDEWDTISLYGTGETVEAAGTSVMFTLGDF